MPDTEKIEPGQLVALILAAGKGTRMKSALPKVAHLVGGRPMICHVLAAAAAAGASRRIVVVGHGAASVEEAARGEEVEFVLQAEQLGTGHAVMAARDKLAGPSGTLTGTIMVLCGDTPLLTGGLLAELWQSHRAAGAAATVLTAVLPDPAGYGRIVRERGERGGRVRKIVEQKDASPEELAINEINTGIYCFEAGPLFSALAEVGRENRQGEYYLTDVIGILAARGEKVWGMTAANWQETLGINSRLQLAEAEAILRRRKLEELMENGVTIMDPASTFVDAAVAIEPDTVIYPFTWLEGRTVIASGSSIGPNTRIRDCRIGKDAAVCFTYAYECEIGDGAAVGPFVHLRPGTVLAAGVRVGNFVEIKNSRVGAKSKIPHLSYIGDTDMGERVNIGSGAITVNYDGRQKHRTVIEDDAFIGCNSNLVAPVTVGRGAYIAAGSTITKDVPPKALGVGRARQSNIEGWVEKRR